MSETPAHEGEVWMDFDLDIPDTTGEVLSCFTAAQLAEIRADAVNAERERLAEEWRTLPVWGPDPSGLHILDGVDLEGLLDDLWDRRR